MEGNLVTGKRTLQELPLRKVAPGTASGSCRPQVSHMKAHQTSNDDGSHFSRPPLRQLLGVRKGRVLGLPITGSLPDPFHRQLGERSMTSLSCPNGTAESTLPYMAPLPGTAGISVSPQPDSLAPKYSRIGRRSTFSKKREGQDFVEAVSEQWTKQHQQQEIAHRNERDAFNSTMGTTLGRTSASPFNLTLTIGANRTTREKTLKRFAELADIKEGVKPRKVSPPRDLDSAPYATKTFKDMRFKTGRDAVEDVVMLRLMRKVQQREKLNEKDAVVFEAVHDAMSTRDRRRLAKRTCRSEAELEGFEELVQQKVSDDTGASSFDGTFFRKKPKALPEVVHRPMTQHMHNPSRGRYDGLDAVPPKHVKPHGIGFDAFCEHDEFFTRQEMDVLCDIISHTRVQVSSSNNPVQ